MPNTQIRKQIIRYIVYIIFVLGLTALAFYLSIGNKITNILEVLKGANILYIIAILAVE